MHLGLFIYGGGYHVSGWRLPDAEAGVENFDLLRRLTQKAEEATFDLVFVVDGLTSRPKFHPSMVVRLEPFTLMPALAACTNRIDWLRRWGGFWMICGSVETVADTLEHWFVSGAVDGFNIMPPSMPGSVDGFVDMVIPILQRRGLFRAEYVGQTLRDPALFADSEWVQWRRRRQR